ncbi:hypothetical protein AB0M20_37715 [Actinoplanes sp. NPDC051633]|uniref:hypothetical protein n=1 Tax=Actinoplanes sp. NPDC051633 TaxID=3155670 RepID=UPI0034385CC0
MAGMTASQRRWEAWFDAYAKIDGGWPERIELPCPEGDGGRVQIAYLAGREGGKGMVFVWCDRCRTGIFLHRVRIPDDAPRLPHGATEDEIDKIIPPDTVFLPPDPAIEPLPD